MSDSTPALLASEQNAPVDYYRIYDTFLRRHATVGREALTEALSRAMCVDPEDRDWWMVDAAITALVGATNREELALPPVIE